MPATAAMIAPPVVVFNIEPDEIEVMANEVEVACAKRELPKSVVEPRMFARVELKAPLIVVEPFTANADEVAEVKVAPANVARPV